MNTPAAKSQQPAASSQKPLFVSVLETRNYIVGAANAPSGLYRYDAAGGWIHLGWRNVRCFGLALRSPEVLFLACGNGVFRSRDAGATWRVTTGWEITEVLDVALDPWNEGGLYAATVHGVWYSPDEGEHWEARNEGLARPSERFTTTVAADPERPGRWLIGTEDGLFGLDGAAWRGLGPRAPIRALHRVEGRPGCWVAGTEDRGLLLSTDGAATWRFAGGDPAMATVYALAAAPHDPALMAAAGYRTGLFVTRDGGRRWAWQPLDLPAHALHALAFDPHVPGRLWLGTVGAGVYHTDDLGRTCAAAGLPETTIYDFAFA
jgi:hypothetical protein